MTHTATAPTAQTGIRQDARNLATWLMLPSVSRKHFGAYERACYLLMLAGSCTPDCEDLIVDEIADIKRIVTGDEYGCLE